MINRRPSLLELLFFLGRPLAPIYSGVMKLRELFYSLGLFSSEKMVVPVISIGNLTMGGTGKTPTVHYLAKMLKDKGYSPAIISRGYGGTSKALVNVVSDKKELFLDALEAGDEPRFLAEALPGIPVLTGKRRIYPCRYAIENLAANVLLLDDGFQHLSVKRDIDLVLFNASTLSTKMLVFPGGCLRESFSALSRATAIVITDSFESSAQTYEQFIESESPDLASSPHFFNAYRPSHATRMDSLKLIDLSMLPKPLFGFCGIAVPSRFQNVLEQNGIQLQTFLPLRDHQQYTETLLKEIEDVAISTGCAALITTEKDMIKLVDKPMRLPIYTVSMEVVPDLNFDKFILDQLQSLKKNKTLNP